MSTGIVQVFSSGPLKGSVHLVGAKNAVLVIMASLVLTRGKNRLTNVPFSEDVRHMIKLLTLLGAAIEIDEPNHTLLIDTTNLSSWAVGGDIMRKMRASILVMGPLLAKFGKADLVMPGGCVLGARPIDYHLKAFARMGATIHMEGEQLSVSVDKLKAHTHILEYPSVGATENILMAAVGAAGTTRIINAALEPEVFDLIDVLKKMGAKIHIEAPATIEITGGSLDHLKPVDHQIMYDRLEAGSLLLAAAITGGQLSLPTAPAASMHVFLAKLEEMGHQVIIGADGIGIEFKATDRPRAVSFKTMPYPGFPTDLQAPMMAVQCLASGTSIIDETVFENRLMHIRELQKMGAQITLNGQTATIVGVDELYGASVIAPDIRASYALVIAGLAAQGETQMSGTHHLKRGYDNILAKLRSLGARIEERD